MRINDTISRSTSNLLLAKSRTFLTAAAIAVGAFAMTIGIAMNHGGGEYANKIITVNTDMHALWVMKKQDEKGSASYPSEYTNTPVLRFNKISVKPINQYDVDKVAAVSGVNEVQPVFVLDSAIVSREGQKEYQASVGVAREGAYRVYAAGDGSDLGDDGVILPDGYRQALGFPTPGSVIGQEISVTVLNKNDPKGAKKKVSFKVKAVMKQSSLSLSLAPTSLYVSQRSAKVLNDHVVAGTFSQNKYIAANARLDPNSNMEEVKQRVISEGYLAQTPGDVYGALYQFVGVLQIVLIGFGAIAVMTAVFGIVNTQYISVLERVQEIGLMKALGMGGMDVGRLFILEAGLIGLVGSGFGTITGYLFGLAANPAITSALGLDEGVDLMKFTFLGTFGVVAILTITSVLAGLLPARQAARLDPVDALRSDKL